MCECDSASTFSIVVRRARVSHRCVECVRTIQPGDCYQYTSGVWDRRGASFATCLACAAVRDHVVCGHEDTCWPCFGELIEWLENGDIDGCRGAAPAVEGHAFGLLLRFRIEEDDRREARLAEWRARRAA